MVRLGIDDGTKREPYSLMDWIEDLRMLLKKNEDN